METLSRFEFYSRHFSWIDLNFTADIFPNSIFFCQMAVGRIFLNEKIPYLWWELNPQPLVYEARTLPQDLGKWHWRVLKLCSTKHAQSFAIWQWIRSMWKKRPLVDNSQFSKHVQWWWRISVVISLVTILFLVWGIALGNIFKVMCCEQPMDTWPQIPKATFWVFLNTW